MTNKLLRAYDEGRITADEYIEMVAQAHQSAEEPCDFDKGFGIGGLARVFEPTVPEPEPEAGAGDFIAPVGTTQGVALENGRCARCGRCGHWNSGAGEILCRRHWDDY